jgi:hypothetical protein
MDESSIKNVMQTLPPSAQVKVIRDGLCEEDGTPSRSDVWSLLSSGSSGEPDLSGPARIGTRSADIRLVDDCGSASRLPPDPPRRAHTSMAATRMVLHSTRCSP